MRRFIVVLIGLAGVAFLVGVALPLVQPLGAWARWDTLAQQAVSEDRATAEEAVAALRARGRAGLEELLAAKASGQLPGTESGPGWDRYRDAVDQVAKQRDAHVSRLFWHDDFAAARAEATAQGRPILSLRLLGNLDEDLSCANSRFFRTVLYANDEISSALRERFVLHWQSVRPVPKLTVDFGDGRRLETTITGNSIHYVLAPDGQVVDALPGLYGPKAFLRGLEQAERIALSLATQDEGQRRQALAVYHRDRLVELASELEEELEVVDGPGGMMLREKLRMAKTGATTDFRADLVFATGSFVTWPEGTKNNVELPIIKSLVPDTHGLRTTVPDEIWSAIARRHRDDAEIDDSSRRLAIAKKLGGGDPSRVGIVERASLPPLFEALQRSVSEETVRNEYIYHRTIHEWLASGEPVTVEGLNDRVYVDLFRSPVNDTWLGLVPPEAYRALDGDGLGL